METKQNQLERMDWKLSTDEKLYGENRREIILNWLKKSEGPLTGKALASKTNVSRQVIVQDISLLKAKNEPIMATARGYLYLKQNNEKQKAKRVIAVMHERKDTEKELTILVDHGITVVDVTVEHPIYGDLTGSLMLENRRDINHFIHLMSKTHASLLLSLTDGVHLHTLEADTEKQLDNACQALKEAGFLLIQP